MSNSRAARFTLVLWCILLEGCSSVAYYQQALAGHWEVMRQRTPIAELIAAEQTPKALRRQLELVLRAREFAVRKLQLPDNDSYLNYSDLGRNFVVWNVFAAPELSLRPVASCFVFVGCLSYRGFFDNAEARAFAATLERKGNDVFVGGVAAYSTLGWFSDPVLNTMLRWDDARIIEVIFHELAHQKIYVEDDTLFNEGFATALASIGIERWFAEDPTLRQRYAEDQDRQRAFFELLTQYRDKLKSHYNITSDDAIKRATKKQLFDDLAKEYSKLKESWNGYNGYDNWMNDGLNNAKLASIATYYDYVPGFNSILHSVDHDLDQFYVVLQHLAKLTRSQRNNCLTNFPGSAACGVEAKPRSGR